MLLKVFEDEQILAAADREFPNQYIQIMTSDIYVKDKQAGRYRAPWLDHECYVSTEYLYEDKLINGNNTRYKVKMSCVLIKSSKYDVLYDTKDVYYVVYEEDSVLKFRKYVELVPTLPNTLELLEAITPV